MKLSDKCRIALISHEGIVQSRYKDSVGVWTIGVGHARVPPGTRWTQAQSRAQLRLDIQTAENNLDHYLPWWRSMSDVRQDAIVNMCFNMGIYRLLKFKGDKFEVIKTTITPSITVPIPKFKEIESKLSLSTIIDGYVTDYFMLENRKFAAVGAMGTGTGIGWAALFIYEIIPISIYKGSLCPMTYQEHFNDVDKGNRERRYNGMLISCERIQHVFIGEKITVKCSNSEKQLEIF